jgi:hypothetical protein
MPHWLVMVLAVASVALTCLLVAILFASILFGEPDLRQLDVEAGLEITKLSLAVVAGIGAVVSLTVAYRRQRFLELQESPSLQPGELLTERIARVQRHLREISALLPALQAELDFRSTALEQLREDAAHYEKVAALHEPEALAVQQMVERTIERGTKRGSRQQLLFFLGGLLSAIPTGVLGNYAYTWLTKG